MSLRHTIKTLLSGPQTQAPPPGGYGYNQGQAPSPHQPQQQQYGAPTSYGYHPGAPVAHGGPVGQAGPYGPQQGQPMMSPIPQAYGYAPPPSQVPQTFAPPPQQQPYQYHCPQAPLNSAPVYQHNTSVFAPQNTPSYGHPPGASPPQLQQTFQQSNPHSNQYSPTPPATATFPPHAQAQGQYPPPVQYGPPPIPSASHPNYQPAASPVFQQQQQQLLGNPAVQYAQAPPAHRQDQQQAPQTPLSPPPPYMRFEQPSLSQSIALTGQTSPHTQNSALDYASPQQSGPKARSPGPQIGQQQQRQLASSYPEGIPQRKSSTSEGDNEIMFPLALQGTQQAQTPFAPHNLSKEPASTKPESKGPENFEGIPPARTNTDGLIHPSMLAQWSAATAIKTGPIPTLPSAQAQLPPRSASPRPSAAVSQNNASPAPPQPTYPGGRGHKPTGSVNRSFTFSKKNADGSPNWNGTLLTIDGMSSETFTRFVNGVYNFAGQDEDPLGLTPDQVRVLLERLDMPDERNYPKRYSSVALKNGASDPAAFVNTSLIQYYSIFDVTYITESNLMPIVTRDGFQQYMTTEVLINPSAMHGRFLRLLTNFGHQIIDPFTKRPFGNVQFERGCLPPVPNDQYVARDKKQQEALQAREEANSSQQYYSGEQQASTYPQSSSWGI